MSRPIKPAIGKPALVIAFCAALAACNDINPFVVDVIRTEPFGSPVTVGAAFLVLDVVSVVNTKKTLDDHVVSGISGKDCSSIRASRGEGYCQPWPDPTPVALTEKATYCYKSLATVTCYEQPYARDAARYAGTRIDLVPVGN